MHLVLVLSAFLLLMAPPVSSCGRGAMYIQKNGYRQIVIAVGDDVPETPGLVERIKEVFIATSQSLYRATRIRGYIHDIKILLPATWKRNPQYKRAGTEQMEKSDVMITDFQMAPAVDKADRNHRGVFVVKATKCGEQGHFMHVSAEALLNGTDLEGPLHKILVHQFAHLRYGVFDEYPSDDDPHFYHGPGGLVEATRCSRAITGWMYDIRTKSPMCKAKGQLPDENCRFMDKDEKGRRGFSSLMYRLNLKHVDGFCDNDDQKPNQLHNPDAPNMQNRMCNGRSVWEVMRSHEDFNNAKNPPRMVFDTTPKFTVLQTVAKRYVLVLDRSLSMDRVPEHLPTLRRGCANFILNIVRDADSVGIVWFAKTGYRAAEMTLIDEDSRIPLLDALITPTKSHTSIGSGIRAAIAVLKYNGGRPGGTAEGGNLIVISDGEENQKPYILDVWDEVFREKVIIHSIAFKNRASSNADKIAKESGGLSFLYNDAANSNALHEAFMEIGERNQDVKKRKIPLHSNAETIRPSSMMRGVVAIDSTLGTNTEFIIGYAGRDIDIRVISPSGKVYLKTWANITEDIVNHIYMFKFKGQGETGRWMYEIKNSEDSKQKVSVTVVSRLNIQSGKYPIMAQAYWGYKTLSLAGIKPVNQTLYASVSQGFNSVLNAQVLAVVERPDQSVQRLPLRDDGFGADLYANDGIYSAYFTGFVANKRYNVKVLVNNTAATVISSVRVVGNRNSFSDQETYNTDTRIDHLQRMASAGSFQLVNYRPQVGKVYAPSQVTDLRVGIVDVHNRTVQLTWTAPAAELDKGKVSEYDIRYARDFNSMRKNFRGQMIVSQNMVVRGSLRSPSDPGTKEDFAIRMPSAGNITYVFCLLSKDLVGRIASSEASNLVSAGMTEFVNKYKPRQNNGPVSTMTTTGIILVSILGVLLLIALILCIIMVARHVYVYRQNSSMPSSPRFTSPSPAGKVEPVGFGPVMKSRRVGPTTNDSLATLNVQGLKKDGITKTVGTGPLTNSHLSKSTLVNVD